MIEIFINKILSQSRGGDIKSIDEKGNANILDSDFRFEKDYFYKLISRENGFSQVVLSDNKVFLAVDYIRTFPLYYAIEEDHLRISDDASWIKSQLKEKVINKNSALEFYQSAFVLGRNTLFNNIFTLQPGEYMFANFVNSKWELSACNYFVYYPQKTHEGSIEKLSKNFNDICYTVFNDLIKRNRGRTFILPLSGGLDSRLIALWLKRLNYNNVVCYSYGNIQPT